MAKIFLSGVQIPTLSDLNIDGELTLDAQAGTSGQVLTSAGAGNTPTWTTVSGGSLGYLANYQTTSSATTTGTITLGGTSVASSPLSFSLLAGNVTGTTGGGGDITISGGNQTNTTVVNSGGTVTIKGGNGNSNQGAGGGVSIDGGTGSTANGNGFVSIGTGAGSDSVTIGKAGSDTTIAGNLTAVPTFPSQAAEYFFAAPSATSGTPVFRAIVGGDLSQYSTPSVGGSVLTWATGLNATVWSSTAAILAGGGTMTGALALAAGTTTLAPLDFANGTNLTTPQQGAVEFDGNTAFITGETSTGSGRQINLASQYAQISTNTAVASNAQWFGSTTRPTLLASRNYHFKYFIPFSKVTAGTVTFQINNSAAANFTILAAEVRLYPVGASAVSMQSALAAVGGSTASSTASASIGAASNFFAVIEGTVKPSVNMKLQILGIFSAGSATILNGANYIVTDLGVTNIGNIG